MRFRIGIIVFSAIATMLVPGPFYDEMRSWKSDFFIPIGLLAGFSLLLIPFMLLFVVGIQYINPISDSHWTQPTHDANPFYWGNPLFFFHFGAFLILGGGCGLVVSALWQGWPALAHGIYSLLAVPMWLLGIRFCIWCYGAKFKTPTAAVDLPVPSS
ncbi:MAG: hypothetical protein AAF593_11685 [Planctomycetota bacterium]